MVFDIVAQLFLGQSEERLLFEFRITSLLCCDPRGGGHSIVKNTREAGSIVWGLGFCLENIVWGSSKN